MYKDVICRTRQYQVREKEWNDKEAKFFYTIVIKQALIPKGWLQLMLTVAPRATTKKKNCRREGMEIKIVR